MGNDLEETLNLVAYERIKGELAAKYPKGQFVGISQGKVVADASDSDELIAKLRALGLDPRRVLAVQTGIEVPKYAIVLGTYGRTGHESGIR
jgi:cobalamin biosynthesis protein CbiG